MLTLSLTLVLAFWLPRSLVFKGGIWLFGVVVWLLLHRENGCLSSFLASKWKRIVFLVVSLALFGGSLLASKMESIVGNDFVVGATFAFSMCGLVGCGRLLSGGLKKLGCFLSEISYTLYVTHFPLLFLFFSVLRSEEQSHFGFEGLVWFFGASILCVGASVILWWLFERRTDQVRRLVAGWKLSKVSQT